MKFNDCIHVLQYTCAAVYMYCSIRVLQYTCTAVYTVTYNRILTKKMSTSYWP